MSENIIIKPDELQIEINDVKFANNAVKSFNKKIDKKNLSLKDVDEYVKCWEELYNAVELFCEIIELDIHTLERIKATWMQVDAELGSKSVFNK